MFPRNRPTNAWRFCGPPHNASSVRVDQYSQNNSIQLDKYRLFMSTTADTSSSGNGTILRVSCDGRADLFGRRHFIGLLPRAIQTIRELPLGIVKSGLDFASNLLRLWAVNSLPSFPVEKYTNITKIIGLDVTLEDNTTK